MKRKVSKTTALLKKYGRKKKIVKIVEFEGLSCQGTKELQYIKECKKANRKLPKKALKQDTPFGSYTPDFEYPDRFVEIKGMHTFMVCLGLIAYRGVSGKSDLQFKKIQWVAKNVKPVDIIIYLGTKEAVPILDIKRPNIDIIVKGGKLLVL